jgi:hypothetical protein
VCAYIFSRCSSCHAAKGIAADRRESLLVTCQGITSVSRAISWIGGSGVAAGGERCVARTVGAAERRGGNVADLHRGDRAVGRWPTAMVQLRGGRDSGAGSSARNSPSSCSHWSQSWVNRIHSASTIASASSSTAADFGCMSVVTSFTSFTDHRAAAQSDQALIAVCSLLLAILIRRGLAFSATGIVRRSTPS